MGVSSVPVPLMVPETLAAFMCLPEAVMNDMLSITQRQREAFMNMLTGAKRANLVEQSRQKTA